MDYINEKLQEFENYIYQKKVAIIGLGVSNIPLLDYLYEKKANVTVFDDRTIDELPKETIDKIDVLNTTPMEALNILFDLKQKIKKGE